MPDGQAGPEPCVALVDRPRFLVRSGVGARAGTKPDCDFAAALLRDLTIDPSRVTADCDCRFEALANDEAAIIERALAVELQAGRLNSQRGFQGWLSAKRDRLGGLFARCAQVMAYAVAPIFSTLLNIDTLAIARRLRADPTLRGKSGGYS